MHDMPLSLIISYTLFSTFVFYQQWHLKNFKGASQLFEVALALSCFAAFICGAVFLIYYGWTIGWYLPILLFLLGLALQLVWFVIEAKLKIPYFPFILS